MTPGEISEAIHKILGIFKSVMHLLFDAAVDGLVIGSLAFLLKAQGKLAKVDAFRFGALVEQAPELRVRRFALAGPEAVSLGSGEGQMVNTIICSAYRGTEE